jgi:hypothetical protein
MSLLLSASPWTNDNTNTNTQPRKRQASIGYQTKQVEMPIAYEESNVNIKTMNLNPNDLKEGLQNIEPSTIEQSQTINEERISKINNLLNQITSISPDNDGNKLANFNPPPPPILNQKNNNITVSPNDLLPQKQVSNSPPSNQNNGNNPKNAYIANDSNLGSYSNYKNSYEPSNIQLKPYYAKMGLGNNGTTDDKLMEKINYMIHLLEEQQNEKTNNVTEEFILYTFLGVFIIFVVDSFARAGKYIR